MTFSVTPEERAHAAKAVCEKIIAGEIPLEKIVAPRWNGETYELAKLKSLRDLPREPHDILIDGNQPMDCGVAGAAIVPRFLQPVSFARASQN